LLGEENYHSAFFHGGRNGTMGFESFTNIAGFEKYYGKDEYGNDADFDGNWGILDGPFFDFFKNELDDMSQPFITAFFSLSSHHPYVVPADYQGMFGKGTLDIHESIMYADHMLGDFMKKASGSEWFANTLFVITADHTSLSDEKEYQSRDGIYAVPLIFYMPGEIKPALMEDIAQHTDILSSVLAYLNYDKPFISFGNNLFDPGAERFSINYLDGTYQLIKDGWSLHFDGEKVTGLFNLDALDDVNQLAANRNVAEDLELFLKTIIQQYNYRMLHNQLILSNGE
jgi:phosphoglycerol transferase MdoB-like AlkP superfamily enzyme